MPFGSVLSVPFDPTEEDYERIERRRLQRNEDLDETEIQDNPDRNEPLLSKQKILRLKCAETLTTIVAIILFIYTKSKSRCVHMDLLISSFFGALIVYPILILSIRKHDEIFILMMLQNLISSLMLYSNGYFIFASWYELKNHLMADGIMPGDPMSEVATFQFLSAILCFITGTIYASEVYLHIYDNIRTLFSQ